MKKFLLVIVIMASVFTGASAQDYKWSIGANLGPSMGASFKYNIDSNSAFEGIAAYNMDHRGPNFSFLYEYHITLTQGLRMYMGGGLNIGALHVSNNKHYDNSDFMFGIDPIIGLEYKFKGTPLVFAFDYKPAFNFTTCNLYDEFAFKLRFAF